MSYIVNKTDGTILTTLLDGTTNSDTGLTLIGRNYTSYGEIQNENFVRLLENFANALPPGQSVGFTPLAGQLWWDTANQRLRVYTGTEFANVSERTVGNTAPITTKVGDQWWDTASKQLKVHDGAAWVLINPPYTSAQGKSGAIVETVTDSTSDTHTVVNTYTNGQLISVTSYDSAFLTGEYSQFGYIKPGINLASNVTVNGTVDNTLKLGGQWANAYPRTAVRTDFLSDLGISGNLVLGTANISVSSGTLVIKNATVDGNVDVYVNSFLGNIRALRINGSNGQLLVSGVPTTTNSVANKGYVDTATGALSSSIISNIATVNTSISQVNTNLYSALTSNVNVLSAEINQLTSDTADSVAALTAALNSNVAAIQDDIVSDENRITSLENSLNYRAFIDSPEFTGTPRAPTPGPYDNSTTLATTQYVDRSASGITGYINGQISALAITTATDLTSGLATKAGLSAPAFTGSPTADTPSSADNSTKLATTAYVRGAITGPSARWQGSRYTVSASGPTGGDDGDFWFQVG